MSDPLNDSADHDETAQFIVDNDDKVKLHPQKVTIKEPSDKHSVDGDKVEFIGLSKDEVLQYANDPKWKKARIILFVGFWVVWVAMLLTAVIIIVQSEKCPAKQDLKWWQKSKVYEIYTRSFKDSRKEDDTYAGNGNFKGISEKLSYLKNNLQISTLWLRGVYDQVDNDKPGSFLGISYKKDTFKKFGSLDDFKALLKEVHVKTKKMKVILDFFPIWTSTEAEWFKTAKADHYIPYSSDAATLIKDYKQKNCSMPVKLNQEMVSKICQVEGHYGLKVSGTCLPLLNLSNKETQKKLTEFLKFWLSLGVDGFVVNQAEYLTLPFILKDQSTCSLLNLLALWRKKIGQKSLWYDKGDNRLFMAQVGYNEQSKKSYDLYKSSKYFGMVNYLISTPSITAKTLEPVLKELYNENRMNIDINIAVSGPFINRVANRVTDVKVLSALNAVLSFVGGSNVIYYGDELGWKSSNGIRPMMWNQENYSGFSVAKPWYPLDNFMSKNVQLELAIGSKSTTLKMFQDVNKLRNMPSLEWGTLSWLKMPYDDIIAYVRSAAGFPRYIVAANLGSGTSKITRVINLTSVSTNGTVVFTTGGHTPDIAVNKYIGLKSLALSYGEAIVLEISKAPKAE